MDISLVIFDLDGTLIDTIGDLSAAVEFALSEGGFPGHSVEEYRAMVGQGIRNLVTRALPDGVPGDVIELTLSRFLEYYTSHIDVLSRPYPGTHDLLHRLSGAGVSLAVASNKFQAGAETLVRRFFPDIPFVKILGNAPGLPLKPDPEVVRLAIGAAVPARSIPTAIYPDRARSAGKRDRALPEPVGLKAVMVGDSATDIKTARNAGIAAVGVSWGFRPRADLEMADEVVDTVDQLWETLARQSVTLKDKSK